MIKLLQMRVVCWNIERGYSPSLIAEFLKDLKADIYLLYEVDRGVKRTQGVDVFEVLQTTLNMEARYVREFYEIDSKWRYLIPWGGPGGGEIGNAIFSRYPLVQYDAKALPTFKPLTYERKTLIPELFQPRQGARQAQVFQVRYKSQLVTFVSTHLELWRAGPLNRQAQLAVAIAGTSNKLRVLAGDFNSIGGAGFATLSQRPGHGEVASMRHWMKQRSLTDPFSDTQFTAGRLGFQAKIDWLANSKDLVVKDFTIISTKLSDHKCLLVDYQVL